MAQSVLSNNVNGQITSKFITARIRRMVKVCLSVHTREGTHLGQLAGGGGGYPTTASWVEVPHFGQPGWYPTLACRGEGVPHLGQLGGGYPTLASRVGYPTLSGMG